MVQLARHSEESYKIINEDFKREIAERIYAEQTKQKLEKALLQGQKLQAIGTLAGVLLMILIIFYMLSWAMLKWLGRCP